VEIGDYLLLAGLILLAGLFLLTPAHHGSKEQHSNSQERVRSYSQSEPMWHERLLRNNRDFKICASALYTIITVVVHRQQVVPVKWRRVHQFRGVRCLPDAGASGASSQLPARGAEQNLRFSPE
jgi:hypothetical protein